MPDIQNYDRETRAYFDTLPKFVQENIIQSGVHATTKSDLEKIVAHLMQSSGKIQASFTETN